MYTHYGFVIEDEAKKFAAELRRMGWKRVRVQELFWSGDFMVTWSND